MQKHENLSSMKRILFSVILTAIVICVFEAAFYMEYKINNLQVRLDDYVSSKENSQRIVWDKKNKIIGPLPKMNFTFVKREYTDIFKTSPLSGSRVGLWSNYPKGKQHVALALGDSFTRGVGSQNPNIASWVSIISNRNPKIEIISLSDAVSVKYHLDRHKNIGALIPHNLVIQATIPADFYEMTNGCQAEDVVDRLPLNVNPDDFLKDYIFPHRLYSPELEYFSGESSVKLFTVYNFLRLAKRFGLFGPGGRYKEYQAIWEDICTELEKSGQFRQENLVKAALNSLPGELQKICPKDGKLCLNFFSHLMKDGNDSKKKYVINYLGRYIKAFSDEARKNGAKFVLLIFPEKQQSYFYKYRKDYLGDLDPFYPIEELKRLIGPDIIIYDMTHDFSQKAKEYEAKGKYLYYKDDGHWNPDGYAVAANLIEGFLGKAINDHASLEPE